MSIEDSSEIKSTTKLEPFVEIPITIVSLSNTIKPNSMLPMINTCKRLNVDNGVSSSDKVNSIVMEVNKNKKLFKKEVQNRLMSSSFSIKNQGIICCNIKIRRLQ